MPLPSFLTSANVILCERFLLEKDEVLSAIRLIEIFPVPSPPPEVTDWKEGDPIPPNASRIRVFVIGNIKAAVGYTGTHRISVRILNSRNEWTAMPEETSTFSSRFPDAPPVIGFIVDLQMVARKYGTSYVCLFLDGEEVARTSLTITAPLQMPQA
jgi:hypothetical protein